jgi:DNA-binding MarR family transcriptional regulator
LGVIGVAGYYRTETFKTANCLGYQIKRAQALLRTLLETAFETEELNFSQWTVLVRLRDGERQTSAELARFLNYDTGSLTRLIDQLEERELLVRKRSKSDRRVHDLALTAAGRSIVNALTPRVIDIHNRVLEGFSRAEVDMLLRLLGRVSAEVEAINSDDNAEAKARARA